MASVYLNKLTAEERKKLIEELHTIQNGKCFITDELIDLSLHKNSLDIDHVVPTKLGGKDEKSNFALTFSSANRSKQASDLNLARLIHSYLKIQDNIKKKEDRSPNLSDLLILNKGSKYPLNFKIKNDFIEYSLSEIGNTEIIKLPVYEDKLSKQKYFFTNIPIEYIFHDNIINPRAIGANITKLISEFYSGNPQLHVSLGWIKEDEQNQSEIKIFDGQHKAAAQIILGVKTIPVRIFINPDAEKLIQTNFRAGTVLRQVAFDKSVQRHLGSTLYYDRVRRYQEDLNLTEDNLNFSEKELLNYFKGESRELKRYILDAVRDKVTKHPENKLMEFVDMGGRAKEKPLSYSSIDKTFYSFFIHQDTLETPLSLHLEEGKNPRTLESEQLVKLMNIIAEEIFIDRFDFEIGTNQIESKIQKGEDLAADHVRAFRMAKEEVLYTWLKFISQIVKNHFITLGKPIDENKIFQFEFPDSLWNNIRNFVKNLAELPLWKNNSLSATVFGGKQNAPYWNSIFVTGNSPQGVKVLAEPINLMELQKER
ncbi:Uncharacterized protein conserved in bacteria [Chryseobacterium taklimakanense]|uniref:Uncharacterized protein conserved in bacteria n=1 Tax=Chryseobacterium taklimakanense TaxID=536441 RepID=A0A239WDY0_9FLAO|nr:HNH endonuclease domain-containing protein [Chryseobacterium taklimakanense]SNV32711.1 Uncharacterized protein conserved in bacteria [Chryseobacterium taklimakanense]